MIGPLMVSAGMAWAGWAWFPPLSTPAWWLSQIPAAVLLLGWLLDDNTGRVPAVYRAHDVPHQRRPDPYGGGITHQPSGWIVGRPALPSPRLAEVVQLDDRRYRPREPRRRRAA